MIECNNVVSSSLFHGFDFAFHGSHKSSFVGQGAMHRQPGPQLSTGNASWAPGSCHSFILSQPLPHTHPRPPTDRCVTISYVDYAPSSWYSVWTLPPQLPGNSQVGPAHYKRSCLPPPLSLASLTSCSYSCSLPPSLHMARASLCYSTLSLSLPFYNKGLKATDCLISSGNAVLEQWSKSPPGKPPCNPATAKPSSMLELAA